MKKLGYWIAGAFILALAILAGSKAGRYKKRARDAYDAADALDAAETEREIGKAKIHRAKANEAQARARTARVVATERINKLKENNEGMADIAKRFNKRVRND